MVILLILRPKHSDLVGPDDVDRIRQTVVVRDVVGFVLLSRRIILAVLVTPGEVMDNQPMLDLLWPVYFRWRVRPKQVTGDTT